MPRLWRSLAVLFPLALACASGCRSWTRYQLAPVARAGDGSLPVKAQVRQIHWARQPESGGLDDEAHVAVDLDVYDADPTHTFAFGQPVLLATPAWGGPSLAFTLLKTEGAWKTLAPGQAQTIRLHFAAPSAEPARGPQRLVLVVPVAGSVPLSITLADTGPDTPRWKAGSVHGEYLFGGMSLLLSPRRNDFTIVEPFGIAGRRSWDRIVLGLGTSFGWVQQDALAAGPPALGLSMVAQLTWQPWRWHVAPYVEGGIFGGRENPPAAYYQAAVRWLALPRVGGGLLFTWGPHLSASGSLPFDRPPSPQRRSGFRFGYTHWFNTGDAHGTDGYQFAFEQGFGP